MNGYKNLDRPGVRSSTSMDPKMILEDIDYTIHSLDPNPTPLLGLSKIGGRGAPPKGWKIQVRQSYDFDPFDYCSAASFGTGDEERFALLTIDQISRPDLQKKMYYHPQDTFWVMDTGENVEVVMTERASIKMSDGTEFAMANNSLTGGTTTRTAAGKVLVRRQAPGKLLRFTTSDIIYLARTVYEGQDIEPDPKQTDTVFDCNFVEHIEFGIEMTEEQKNWIKTKGTVPDWTFQQENEMKKARQAVELKSIFGRRTMQTDVEGSSKGFMNGLFNVIKTNNSFYNPTDLTDFESMFGNFLFEQGFRYNPYGYRKIGYCGGRFLYNFNQAFKEYRRTSDLQGIGKEIGLNFDTYMIPGGQKLSLIRTEALRINKKVENWCFVIEPKAMEWRVLKDFDTRFYQLANQRKVKIAIEWMGSIAWHLEQSHACLRTV